MKARIITVLFLCALFLPSPAAERDNYYIGNSRSKIYHTSVCGHTKRMADKNYVTFESVEDAIKNGYRPCQVCNPPTITETTEADSLRKRISELEKIIRIQNK